MSRRLTGDWCCLSPWVFCVSGFRSHTVYSGRVAFSVPRSGPVLSSAPEPHRHPVRLVCFPACLLVCFKVCLLSRFSACVLSCLSAFRLVCLSAFWLVCLSAFLFVCLSAFRLVCFSVCRSVKGIFATDATTVIVITAQQTTKCR